MIRWRGAIGTTLLLLVLIAAVGVRPTSPSQQQAGSQTNASSSVASLAPTTASVPNFHSTTSGFDVVLPNGWSAADDSTLFSRYSVRLLVIGNRGTDVPHPQFAPPPPPGQLPDWSRLASDRIVLELVLSAGPGGPRGAFADTESSFPLDWNSARPLPDGSGSTAATLFFQHLAQSLTLVAHVGTAAPATDVAEIAGIVSSLRPEPIPASGEYRGWNVVGPLASFQVGTVTHFGTSAPRGYGFYVVRGTNTVFAFLDSAYLFMGAMKPCPIRYEALSRTFVCDDTSERWSRVGKQLTEPGYLGLAYHLAFVKNGLVLVGGSTIGSSLNANDESAEFVDPISPSVATGPLTKAEILGRYSRLTSTSPTIRAVAKLVPAEVAMRSQIFSGVSMPPATRTVWIVAFAGDVHLPGSSEVHGKWTIFIADPRTGGVITAACCGEGDWPPGFDQLPDVAVN